MPIILFLCYAHEDEALLEKLRTHLRLLQRQGLVDIWYDREIMPGTEWKHEFNARLNEANIILLLISPDFIDSEYCYSFEMQRSLELQKIGKAKVIPVLARPVDLQGTPLVSLQVLPLNKKPITMWENQDKALEEIALCVRHIVEDVQKIGSFFQTSGIITAERKQEQPFPFEEKVTDQMYKLVMVIDDSPNLLRIIKVTLEREGYKVKTCADGIEALMWLMSPEARIPELIFMDIGMPKMDGYEVTLHLKSKQKFKNTVIVMFSKRDGVIDRLKGYKAGAKGYITKPFRTQDIISATQRYIGLPNLS